MVLFASFLEIVFISIGCLLLFASVTMKMMGDNSGEAIITLIVGLLIIYLSIHIGPINISISGAK